MLDFEAVTTLPGQAQRIPELDGIRGIAILLVIGCHYAVFARQLWGLPKLGWVGVDIFFVLSGYLITSVLLKLRGRENAFRLFYSRRFRRILPAYIILIALVYLLTAVQHDYSLYNLREVVKNALFLQSFHVSQTLDSLHRLVPEQRWRLAYSQVPSSGPGLTGHVSDARAMLWSLSIEEYFYLLWAPAVLWMNRKWLAITGIAICLAAFAFRWLAFIGFDSYFSAFHRFDALIFGSFVALLVSSAVPKKRLSTSFIFFGSLGAGILAAVLAPMGNVLTKEIRDDRIFITFGLISLSLLAASAVGLAVTKSGARYLFFLRSPTLRFIGAISYSLYLFHGLTYLLFLHFFQPTWGASLTALGCAFGLSLLSWRYIELPILSGAESTMLSTNQRPFNRDPQSETGEVAHGSMSLAMGVQFNDELNDVAHKS
jgi:peptidoglycan/LPS O-acetylase OafA/YrhL